MIGITHLQYILKTHYASMDIKLENNPLHGFLSHFCYMKNFSNLYKKSGKFTLNSETMYIYFAVPCGGRIYP